MKRSTILTIDDNPANNQVLSKILGAQGYEILMAENGKEALKIVSNHLVDLILCDLYLPTIDRGVELIKNIKEVRPYLPIIIVTAFGDVESAVDMMKYGVYYYLSKPLDYKKLHFMIARAIEQTSLLNELDILRREVQKIYQFQCLIGKSEGMQQVYQQITNIANTDTTVIIKGETGTGKEMVARAIHYSGRRKSGPFIPVNCAAIPETLLESELFGHEKGAFTGATTSRTGKFELANDGTLFLDEIGDLSLTTQVKLLRFLQEHEFERLGGDKTIRVNVRVLTATHQDLKKAIVEKTFREDLYYRINVFPIKLPPLRERKEDIRYLAEHFLKKFIPTGEEKVMAPRILNPDTFKILYDYEWPGNVRELENVIERLVVTSKQDNITPDYLPEEFQCVPKDILPWVPDIPDEGIKLDDYVEEFEKRLIQKALIKTRGRRGEKISAAELLGITRRVLWGLMQKHGLND